METPPPPIRNRPNCPAENLMVPKRPNRKPSGRTFTELASQCRFCSPKKNQYGLQAYSIPITKRSHFWQNIFTQTIGSTGLLDRFISWATWKHQSKLLSNCSELLSVLHHLFPHWNKSSVTQAQFLTVTLSNGSCHLNIRIKSKIVRVHRHKCRQTIQSNHT